MQPENASGCIFLYKKDHTISESKFWNRRVKKIKWQ